MKKFLILMAVFCSGMSSGFASDLKEISINYPEIGTNQGPRAQVNFSGKVATLTPANSDQWIHLLTSQDEKGLDLTYVSPFLLQNVQRQHYCQDFTDHPDHLILKNAALKIHNAGYVHYSEQHEYYDVILGFQNSGCKVVLGNKSLTARTADNSRNISNIINLFTQNQMRNPSSFHELAPVGGPIQSLAFVPFNNQALQGHVGSLQLDFRTGELNLYARNVVPSIELSQGYQWKRGS